MVPDSHFIFRADTASKQKRPAAATEERVVGEGRAVARSAQDDCSSPQADVADENAAAVEGTSFPVAFVLTGLGRIFEPPCCGRCKVCSGGLCKAHGREIDKRLFQGT